MTVESGENRFRRILDRLPDAVVLLDHEGRIRYANSTALRLSEKTALQVGSILWDVAPAPLARPLQTAFDRIRGGHEVLILRSYFARGRWYEFVGFPTSQEIAVLGRDITEHLQAEALRRQSEERFRILIEGIKDYAIVLLDLEGRISSWNDGAERLYGYSAEEVLGQEPGPLFYPPEQAPGAHDNLEAAVAHGHHEDEGWRVRKDGERMLVNALYYPLYDQLGQPSGFAVVNRNVTEQRRMQQRIRTSEECLRLALDSAELGTWDYHVETDQLLADARTQALSGLPPQSAPYRRQDILERIHPADRERVRGVQDQAGRGGSYRVEYRINTGSKPAERWLEGRGKGLLDATGKAVRVIGVVHDVTERHRHDEFRQLLPGIIAHDLRSPLSTVKMAGQAMQKTAALSPSFTRFTQVILRSVDQMAKMTDELLDFAQASFGGGFPLHRTPADLADIASEAVTAARIRCPDCAVELDTHGAAQGVWDRTRMLEIIGNLIGNAIKHGSRAEAIGVAVRGEGDDVLLTVHNSGPPIPADLMPCLFDPFRRAQRADSRQMREKSYGLGLYIIREIVTAHAGTIDVRSSSEAGTTFTVRLPRGLHATTEAELSP